MLHFIETDNSKTYFTSDTHFNHNPKWEIPLWKQRGYNSPEEHTQGIIDKINERVRENDNLIHMGDFCLNTNEDQFEVLISKLNCQNIYMIWGNHPNSHFKRIYKPMVSSILKENYTNNSEIYPLRYKNIIYIGHYAEITVNGQLMVLCHYPISVFNKMRNGVWHLCGHSHYNFDPSTAENLDSKTLDVGWDGFARPLSFPEIYEIMSKKGITTVDHH